MERNPELTYKQFQVETYDGASLDTLEIKPTHNKDKKYIVYIAGREAVYDKFLDLIINSAKELQATIIAFNYRGMGRSSKEAPRSIDDLVTDGITQVQRLLAKGVSAERIMLNAHSLGGWVAILVAKYFHDRGQKVYLFNDRSFSSLTDMAVGWLRTCGCFSGSGHNEWFLMKGIAALCKPLIFGVLWLLNWEADVVGAFNDIPAAYKKYLLVRSPKPIRAFGEPDFNMVVPDDSIIPHYASLHQGIKDRAVLKAVLKDVLIGFAAGVFIGLAAAGIVAATGGTALLALVILPPAIMIVTAAANGILSYFQRASDKRAKKEEQFDELKKSWPLNNKPCPTTFKEELANKKNYKVINDQGFDDRSLGKFYAAYRFFRHPNKMIHVNSNSRMGNDSPDNTFEYRQYGEVGQSHVVPNKYLVNARGQTGWQFFKNFFNEMKCDEKTVNGKTTAPLIFKSSTL